jgi:hypothetical protein
MGMNIGGAFKSVLQAVKPLAMEAIKSASPDVQKTLKDIASSGFDAGAKILTTSVGKLPGIGPLAQKTLEDALPGLKEKGFEALEKGVKDLLGSAGPKVLENGQTVTTPKLENRDVGVEVEQAVTQAKEAVVSHPSINTIIANSSKAAAAFMKAGNTSSAVHTGPGSGPSVKSILDRATSGAATMSEAQNKMLAQMKTPQKEQLSAQFELQNYGELVKSCSDLMKKMGEISNSILSNIK